MKKYLYGILSLAVGLFSSCSSVDNSELTDNHTTLTLSVDGAMSTRSADESVTYYVEAYSDATYETPANIFDDNINNVSNTTGSISMILDRSQKYYFLFFATKDASCYDAMDLKAIALQSGKNPSEAWFGTKEIEGKAESVKVELKRCVAKLSLIETGVIPAKSTLTLTFDQPTKFDVSTGNISTDVASRTETISLTDGFTSSEDNNVINSDDDIFVLASSGASGNVSTLKFQMSNSTDKAPTEDAIEVTNVPFQANHNTNIKGHYTSLSTQTFTVTANDAWGIPENEVAIGGSSVVPNFKSEYTASDFYQWDAVGNVTTTNSKYNTITSGKASNSCKDCPTADQIKMYLSAENGVYWDDGDVIENGLQTYKEADAENLHKGVWLLKKKYITGFNNNTADKSKKKVTFSIENGNIITINNAEEIRTRGKYFFLPAAGICSVSNNKIEERAVTGAYWISSPCSDSSVAYYLYLRKAGADLYSNARQFCYLPWVAE